jgi:hypothetical protein
MVGILTLRRFPAAATGLAVRRLECFSAHRETSSELVRIFRTGIAMVGLLRKRGALPDARGARPSNPWKDGG